LRRAPMNVVGRMLTLQSAYRHLLPVTLVLQDSNSSKESQGSSVPQSVVPGVFKKMTMNFFEIFGLTIQLKVDKTSLPKKYFELSKQFHPDFFSNATPAEQQCALEISASLNKAFKTFQNPDETIKYVLQLKNLLQEEEKYVLPKDFLMEVLEINEQLMDATDNPELKSNLQSALDNLQSEIYAPVKQIVEHYQEDLTSEKELLQVKEYYYKKKYLQRIQRQLNGLT
jgi:molecular chaperone HscB